MFKNFNISINNMIILKVAKVIYIDGFWPFCNFCKFFGKNMFFQLYNVFFQQTIIVQLCLNVITIYAFDA
jgi:hypothetical protein